jgi:hypothetical protein
MTLYLKSPAGSNSRHEEMIDRLQIMLKQEQTCNYDYCDYLTAYIKKSPDFSCESNTHNPIDQECRKKMVSWCFSVIDHVQFSRETVAIAMNYLDRFLSSGDSRAKEVLLNRKEYQLASMTCLFTAIKIWEKSDIGIDVFVELSRGAYSKTQLLEMEITILNALQWRLATPTCFTFLQEIINLLLHYVNCDASLIASLSFFQLELAVADYTFVSCKPSKMALASINNTFQILNQTIPSHLVTNYLQSTSNILNIDLFSPDMCDLANRIRSPLQSHDLNSLNIQSPLSSPNQGICHNSLSNGNADAFTLRTTRSYSPICISKTSVLSSSNHPNSTDKRAERTDYHKSFSSPI